MFLYTYSYMHLNKDSKHSISRKLFYSYFYVHAIIMCRYFLPCIAPIQLIEIGYPQKLNDTSPCLNNINLHTAYSKAFEWETLEYKMGNHRRTFVVAYL